jgi:hypothetical protein
MARETPLPPPPGLRGRTTLKGAGEQSHTTTWDNIFQAAGQRRPCRRTQQAGLRACGRWSAEAIDFDVGSKVLYISPHTQRA